jgi:SAM-dependent methyltransferase
MQLLPLLRRRFREGVREHGFVHTLSAAVGEGWYFLRNSTPSRRRQRYGDLEFDWERRINTTAGAVNWRTRLAGVLAGSYYQPSDPGLFHEMIGHLPIDPAEYTFIDLGSGKGRALLLAAEYPFRRIIGVEVLPELHRAAQENVRTDAGSQQIDLICCDAAEFEFPPEPTVLYLFNPLHEAGLRRLVKTLEDSLQTAPRPVWIVYHNALLEHVFATSSFQKVCGTHQYVIYSLGE